MRDLPYHDGGGFWGDSSSWKEASQKAESRRTGEKYDDCQPEPDRAHPKTTQSPQEARFNAGDGLPNLRNKATCQGLRHQVLAGWHASPRQALTTYQTDLQRDEAAMVDLQSLRYHDVRRQPRNAREWKVQRRPPCHGGN